MKVYHQNIERILVEYDPIRERELDEMIVRELQQQGYQFKRQDDPYDEAGAFTGKVTQYWEREVHP